MSEIFVAEKKSLATPALYASAAALGLVVLAIFRFADEPQPAAIAVAAVAGIALAFAAYRTLRRLKFGDSRCVIHDHLGIGAEYRGEILAPVRDEPRDGFSLRLVSIRSDLDNEGGRSEVQLWEEEQQAAREALVRTAAGVRIPFRFEIPISCEPTNRRGGRVEVFWRLAVEADTPGIAYAATFEVPVSRATLPQPLSATVRPAAAEEIALGPRHGPHEWIVLVLIPAACATAIYWLGPDGIAVSAFLGLIGLALAILGFDVLLGHTHVRADPKSITIRRARLGLGRRIEIPASEVASIETRPGITLGSRAYYDVVIGLPGGRTKKAFKHLVNVREADALTARLIRAIGRG